MSKSKSNSETTFNLDNVQDLRNIKTRYKPATKEENYELFMRYQNGDAEAYELLFLKNIGLILMVASKYFNKVSSMEMSDLIQEGVKGLIKAIQNFNPEKGAFSTYATPKITSSISRSIKNTDKMIRVPINTQEKINKYKDLINQCNENGRPIPDDKEIKDILDISDKILKACKEAYILETTSLNTEVKDDSDTTLENFIPYEEKQYNQVETNYDNFEMFAYLKTILSPIQYYVIYYRTLSENTLTCEELGKILGLKKQRIDQIEKKALHIIAPFFKNHSFDKRLFAPIENINSFNILPINIDSYIRFLFISSSLPTKAQELYKMWITRTHNYERNYYCMYLNISAEELQNLEDIIRAELDNLKNPTNHQLFQDFKNHLLTTSTTAILNLDLKPITDNKYSILRMVAKEFESTSASEVLEKAETLNIQVDANTSRLIHLYFKEGDSLLTSDEVEREINLIKFGFQKNHSIPNKQLYDFFKNNPGYFTQEQYDFLEAFYFNKMSRKSFYKKHPDSKCTLQNLTFKLEKTFFHINSLHSYNLTKEKYELLRSRALKSLDPEKIRILDLFYGIGTKPHSSEEISTILGVSLDEERDLFRKAKDNLLALYLKEDNTNAVSDDIYIQYLENDDYEFNAQNREITLEYLKDKTPTDVLGKKYKQTRQLISNRIIDTKRDVDFYRFGIKNNEAKYSEEEFDTAINQLNLTSKEASAVKDITKGIRHLEVSKTYDIPLDDIKKLMKKVYMKCYKNKVSTYKVTLEDIVEEVQIHPSETILLEQEREVLSMFYGIRTPYNSQGKTYSSSEINKKLGIISSHTKNNALESIAAKKIGLIKNSITILPRKEISDYLNDPRLPISEKERVILSQIYGIGGYQYKTLKKIAKELNEKEGSIRRRIMRAFLSILKYKNGEILPTFSFELDIEPFLKFFPKNSQQLLTYHFKDRLSTASISKLTGLTKDQINKKLIKLKAFLLDYQKGLEFGYDFDYFYSTVENDDVPYYRDKGQVLKMFHMYYEEDKTYSNIVEELGIDLSSAAFFFMLDEIKIAVCKRRIGITKNRTFSYEEIREYYLSHKEEMSAEHKIYYLRYFERINKNVTYSRKNISDIPPAIILDLIKEETDDYISLSDTKKAEIIHFVLKHRENLSTQALSTLMYMYNIQGKEFMSGKNRMKVLSLLYEISMKEEKSLNMKI